MSDDRQEPPADETRPLPRSDDATRPLPRSDGPSRPSPTDDATRPLPAHPHDPSHPSPSGDATRPLPPTGGAAHAEPTGAPVWSGRAGVPPPRPAEPGEPAEWYGEEQRGRRWWTPILLGVLALLLFGLLGTGLWLALRAADSPPDETPPPTVAPTTGGAPTTGAPTTAAPTTGPPSSPPTTGAAAQIPVPPLVGLSRATAQTLLGRLGLSYRVATRESDQPPGTVLATDPGTGELVSPGDEVTLVVAAAASPSPTPTGTRTGTPTPEVSPTG
ncbi:PASTA domain-containing protein [Micromonospora sp. NPDC092111]|uniref:PASTA domain-containing protein n=1 Tax=Micromonospora sp. NPDC092111 TaxID=3364289 RepID=UPI00380375BD